MAPFADKDDTRNIFTLINLNLKLMARSSVVSPQCCLFVLAATVAKGRVKPGQQQNGGLDQTFGDDERKCVKEFKEAYTSFSKVRLWYGD